MTPIQVFKRVDTNEINKINKSKPGLKILGWVKLSCQFKSGSGHQFSEITREKGYSHNFLNFRKCFKMRQMKPFDQHSDTTMTPQSQSVHSSNYITENILRGKQWQQEYTCACETLKNTKAVAM